MANSGSHNLKKTSIHSRNFADKENIPLNHKETSKAMDNQSNTNNLRFTIYDAKPKWKKKTVDNKNTCNVNEVRFPLKDVARKNTHGKVEIPKKLSIKESCQNNQRKTGCLKDCASQTDFSDEEFYEYDVPIKSSKAKDSFPLNISKLNSTKSQLSEILDEVNMKHVTYKRDYDMLQMENSFENSLTNLSSNDFLFDDTENNDEKEQFHDVLNIPQVDEVKTTPLNINDPPECLDIKLARRCFLKNILMENENQKPIVHKKLFADNLHDNLKSQEILGISPLVLHNKNKKFLEHLHKVRVLGTVNLDVNEPFMDFKVLYCPMYLESAVKHMLKNEMLYSISPFFIKAGLLSDMNRSVVVNWLMKLQSYMKTEHTSLYTAVRLLDKAIDSLKIPLHSLQLVALASFWMSLKFHAVEQKQAKSMVKLTEGVYTSKELIEMEQAVFKANGYNINALDISTFIHYYILLLNIPDANMISECSHYLLNCSYLNSVFVFIQPSKMAAAAVFTSLHLMNQYSDALWMKLSAHVGYYSPGKLILLMENLVNLLKQMNDPSFPCREPFIKYSSSKHHRVSLIVMENLTQEEH